MSVSTDPGFWQWLIGLAVAALTAAIGWLHRRINRVEDSARDEARAAEKRSGKNHDALWEAIDRERGELRTLSSTLFRDYPTKKDLEGMEARLMRAISSRPVRGSPPES